MKPNDGWRPTRLEEALGPAAGRFFGAGYRTVKHKLEGERKDPDVFEGVGHVSYPEDWSVREDGTRRTPHLSTIDAVTLPLQAISRTWHRPPGEFVSAIHLRAGSQPWLDLETVPVVIQPTAAPEVLRSRDHSRRQSETLKRDFASPSIAARLWTLTRVSPERPTSTRSYTEAPTAQPRSRVSIHRPGTWKRHMSSLARRKHKEHRSVWSANSGRR